MYDFVVVGSGFGGSVSALRLAQKGYRVAVIEEGRRFGPDDFPETTWDARRYHFMPRLGCHGIQRMDLLRHALVVGGAGVGGGSLVYGNTLFEPLAPFFELPRIRSLGGAATLRPYYELCRRMMGVTPNPRLFEPDRLLRETAGEYGRAETFTPSPVGVFFGDSERPTADPYFLGEGPARQGCNCCGGCFVGCRYDAKNSLDRNYLYLAEQLGVEVIPQVKVTAVEAVRDGFVVHSRDSTTLGLRRRRTYRAEQVVVAAGVMGSLRLLLRSQRLGGLPRLSGRLGFDVRTNSESILGVMAPPGTDFSKGIAASSSVFPDEHTQVQADRYPAGSDTMGLLSTLLVPGDGLLPRPVRWLGEKLRHPWVAAQAVSPRGFAQRSIVLVVMQDLDSSFRLVERRLPFGGAVLGSEADAAPIPSYIPIANDFAERLARRVGGVALSSITEVLLDAPATAHILGGCVIGDGPEEGVVDSQHRAFGHPGLRVADGSVIPANLGVNPALSILAFAERAMSFVPTRKGRPMRFLEVDRAWGVQDLLLPPRQDAERRTPA
ncbi:MAG: GMC family oxidoreductase [Deltaproteobacteria bacterium]|jgi:cholesterol oxidase|nr:GMC family oxidoreductase [Deltaproteobacteria bacterium]MBW2537611.1 GMC family oxidoreductase [Deltaproteobacteria bacterium]